MFVQLASDCEMSDLLNHTPVSPTHCHVASYGINHSAETPQHQSIQLASSVLASGWHASGDVEANIWQSAACRPIVILAERDKLAMDAELEFILRDSKIQVITREGQCPAVTLISTCGY